MSLKILTKLNDANIRCTVLTKGVLPIELSKLSKENEYGITLVSLDEHYRECYEPGAAPYDKRIASLKRLHDAGYKTWISIEPYPTPNIIKQDILKILSTVNFADKIIFGRTNYSKEITSYTKHREFYNSQAELVVDYCRMNNIAYHIKEGTITVCN